MLELRQLGEQWRPTPALRLEERMDRRDRDAVVGTTSSRSPSNDLGPFVVDPNGGLILAEDGEGIQHLVGITAAGRSFPMARNELEGCNEFTGPTFSADGQTLFANVQDPGHVFIITGPFHGPGTPSNSR